MITNTKKDNRPYIVRMWQFQRERAPLFAVLIMASATVGVIYNYSSAPIRNYLVAVAIIVLYLIQIRTSDEKKDFEHDNQFHQDRPVQRGVVTLEELHIINIFSIVLQLILYASFLDIRIFMLGLLSQGYAFLTRKEFFVREWIRQHFFTYYFLHYAQLVILFYATINIIKPTNIRYWELLIFIMLNIIMTELGRKMFPIEEDTTDDTYSAQLGHRGSATALSAIAVSITLISYYFITHHTQHYLFIIAPILGLGLVLNSAYHYAIDPNKRNAKNVENSANLMYLICMLSVILGA